MSENNAYTGVDIFDGEKMWESSALLIADDLCSGIVPEDQIPEGFECIELEGGFLTAGFVDLQVNGGGGVLFNDAPTVESIEIICNAHQQFGTTALLPTLITDTPEITHQAIEAGKQAQMQNIPGFLGLHLEGPHLSVEKKGAHRPDLIRTMNEDDLAILCEAKQSIENLLVTLAPESVTCDQITKLAKAGIRVSLGHTTASAIVAKQGFKAGASSVTHLFNAMSGLNHREPGVVGAALNEEKIYCGLIADGIHVDVDAINIALKMKSGEGKLFLVTDAMSTIGTDQKSFTLNDREITRDHGQLTLDDGTLAGADLDMISAVRFMAENTACSKDEALRMASLYPSNYLNAKKYGRLGKSARADFIHINDHFEILSVWQMGQQR